MENDLVRHLLIGRFRVGTTDEAFQAFIMAFRDLSHKLEGIVSFEFGTNNSTEGLNHGMTHVIAMTFANVQKRDDYLQHPEHQKFAWLFSNFLYSALDRFPINLSDGHIPGQTSLSTFPC